MNCQARLQIAIVITLLLSSSLVFGDTGAGSVTINSISPDSLPKGATVNDIDGDHHFMQAINFTLVGAGTYHAETFTLTIPSGISLADPDGDSDYKDGVSISCGSASLTKAGATHTVYSAAAQSIVFKTTRISGGTDSYSLIFPVTTTLSASDSVRYIIAVTGCGGLTADKYAQFSRKTTSQDTFFLDLVTWSTSYDGTAADSTDTEGRMYPSSGTSANMLSVALPDWVTDRTGVGNDPGQVVNGSDTDFESITLDNDDTSDEIAYYVWGSKLKDLVQISGENADIKQGLNLASSTRGASSSAITAQEDDKILILLDTKIYDEGDWYFYLTSSLTADWVIGRSGKVKVTHRPTFINAANEKNESFGIDYDNDFIIEPDGDDDQSAITVDGAEALGRDGTIGSAGYSVDSLGIFYNVFDYDDEARIRIYRASTSLTLTSDSIYVSGTQPNEVVDSLAGATALFSDSLIDEETNNIYYYKPARSTTDYDAAGTYYLYAVANDGKWQTLKQMTNGAGTAMTLTIKYFPKFRFDDDYYTNQHSTNYSGNNYTLNTNEEQYYVINWGNTIDGDKEIDGTMKVYLFASDLSYANAGGSATPSSVDTSLLFTDAVADTDGTVLIASLLDTSDTKEANRYMWDARNSGLANNTAFYIYAVVTSPIPSGGRDVAVVTLNTAESMLQGTQRTVTLLHKGYGLPKGPVEGEVLQLDQGDSFDLTWESFDMNASAGMCEVAAMMVPTGTSIASTVSWTVAVDDEQSDYWWLVPSSNGIRSTRAAGDTTGFAPGNSGRYTISVADLDLDMKGASSNPLGTYDVYYFFSSDGTFNSNELAVKADGQLYFSANASQNANYNWRIQPTKATLCKGDTITLSIYGTDNSSTNPMALSVYLNVPADAFTIIDQDTTSSWTGTTPFTEVTTTFNGTVTKNKVTTVNGVYQCDWETHYDNGTSSANLANTKVATIQLIAKRDASADVLDEQIISFNTTGSRVTKMTSTSFVDYGTNVAPDAAKISLPPRGKITGFVDMQALDTDSGQVVNLYVCGEGGFDCISDSTFLAQNNDTDASDGIQYTLGANGKYTLSAVPAGKYDVICKKPGWLDRRYETQTVQPYSTTTVNFNNNRRMLAGDCAGYDHDGSSSTGTYPNNILDSDDYDLIESYFNKTWKAQNDTGWHSYADFNQDSVINLADLHWPSTNYADSSNGMGIRYPNTKPVATENSGDAQVELYLVNQIDDMNVYGVRSTNYTALSDYDVQLYINQDDWEIVSIENKLKSQDKIFFTKKRGFNYDFVSATLGHGVSNEYEQVLFTFTLKPRVEIPSKPRIQDAMMINVYHQINTPVIHVNVADDNNSTLPMDYSLSQNYPNPFNPTTRIQFALPEAGDVKLTVYNMMGQQVRTLLTEKMDAGFYKVLWNGMDDAGIHVASGMYLYRIQVGSKFVQTKKMLLLK